MNKGKEDNNKLQKERTSLKKAVVVKSAARATLATVFAIQDIYKLPQGLGQNQPLVLLEQPLKQLLELQRNP